MAATPAFAATPRIGVGHITAATADTGTNGSPAAATGTVTVTFPTPTTGSISTDVTFAVYDTATGQPTGVFLRPAGTVTFTAQTTVTVPVQTTDLADTANGWTSSSHHLGLPVPNPHAASDAALASSLSGGVDATWAEHRSTGTPVTVLSGGPAGTKVAEVSALSTGPLPEPAVVVLWLHDGDTDHPYAELLVPAGAPDPHTTGPRAAAAFASLLLPDETWSLRATAVTVPPAGELVVTALAGDL